MNSLSDKPTFSLRLARVNVEWPPWASTVASTRIASVRGSTARESHSYSASGRLGTSLSVTAPAGASGIVSKLTAKSRVRLPFPLRNSAGVVASSASGHGGDHHLVVLGNIGIEPSSVGHEQLGLRRRVLPAHPAGLLDQHPAALGRRLTQNSPAVDMHEVGGEIPHRVVFRWRSRATSSADGPGRALRGSDAGQEREAGDHRGELHREDTIAHRSRQPGARPISRVSGRTYRWTGGRAARRGRSWC